MSSSQFSEWMAYASIEPFGEWRQELRHGQSMAQFANVNRDTKAKPTPFKPVDFMNFIEKPEAKPIEETPEKVAARMDREFFRLPEVSE